VGETRERRNWSVRSFLKVANGGRGDVRKRPASFRVTDKGVGMDLEGRVAVVTGGAMGIGKGIAGELAAEGAAVVVSDVNDAAGEETTSELKRSGAKATYIHCDTSDEGEVKALMRAAVQEFDHLDVLVNNAGLGIFKSVTEATVEEFDRALAVNLRGPFLCMKYATPPMREAGRGSIINIASVHSVQNVGGTAPYAASKGGVAALTRAAAIDFSPDNIRVNAICPGWVDTPLVRGIFDATDDPEAARREIEERQLLRRLGQPEDIGRAAVFLASDDSSYMTGSLMFVDNGMTAQLEVFPE
jgi:NAD(P)-dependent dehydrogenase (short-subunit alcohol dehydrogenase family)